jgi:tetratricopeptide (TPR) repeat protein
LAVLALWLALLPGAAEAVMSGEESRLAPSGDADYAAGKDAFKRKDWEGTVANLTLVVLRRPWHDNAHAMLGFAWRKLGNFDLSLEHYDAALSLNPRHKGALEYLGEAYLELGRIEDAQATYRRLVGVCRFVVMGFDNQGWKSGCEELDDLKEAFAERGVPLDPTVPGK